MFEILFPVSIQKLPKYRGLSWIVEIFSKCIRDPLFWAAYIAFSALGFFASMVFGPALPLPILMIGLSILGLFGAVMYIRRRRKEIFYELSLLLLLVRNTCAPHRFPWWNRMDENLYLGGIPLQEKGHLEEILRTTNISAILSLIEDFELENRWPITTPVSHSAWKEKGFETLQISCVDLEGATLEEVERGVAFIREMSLQGRHTYVHCKAGLGRSATVVACYLLQYGRSDGHRFVSVEEVIAYSFTQRKEVHLDNAGPKAVIQQYFEKYLIP